MFACTACSQVKCDAGEGEEDREGDSVKAVPGREKEKGKPTTAMTTNKKVFSGQATSSYSPPSNMFSKYTSTAGTMTGTARQLTLGQVSPQTL